MKNFVTILLAAMFSLANIHAQQSDFEAWAQRKREEYDKWKKLRGEIAGRLPQNDAMNSISSFIDQGFAAAKPAGTTSGTQATTTASNTSPAGPATTGPQAAVPQASFKVWVVIAGVAEYLIKENNLRYTKDDAYKIYAFYKSPEGGALPDRQIALLVDEDATRANIVNAIKSIYSQAGRDDAIIFYFSGHGAEGAFITHEFDGNVDDNYKGLLLHDELNYVFQSSPARYKYLIADACHSGSLVNRYGGNKDMTARGAFYQAFEKAPSGFVMILSSMGDEYSLESSGIRQGVFSHYLLRGLKGESDTNRDKTVTVDELFDFTQSNVKGYTKGKQNPVISGDYNELLPMAVVRE
jgi:hypothetical protein